MARTKSTNTKTKSKAAAETPAKEVKPETTVSVDKELIPIAEVNTPAIEGDANGESNVPAVPASVQETIQEAVPENTPDIQAPVEPGIDIEAEAKKEKARYKGKVRLSNVDYDTIDKKEAKKLVEESHIHQHYKNIMLIQIENGALTHQYAESLKRIRSAVNGGSTYLPGTDGL